MPPDESYGYGQPAQQAGYSQQQSYPPIQQPAAMYGSPMPNAYGSYTMPYAAVPPPPAPYGPPPGRPEPLYGSQAPGATAGVPYDPYAWQRGAIQAPPQPQFIPDQLTATQYGSYGSPQMTAAAPGQGIPGYDQYAYQYGAQQPMTQYAQQPQAYGQIVAPPAYQQSPSRPGGRRAVPKRFILAGSGVGAVLVVVIGITLIVNSNGANKKSNSINVLSGFSGSSQSSDQLLQAALGNALQTKSYSQKVSDKTDTIQRNVDVSTIKTPRITGSGVIGGTGTEFDAYANVNNTYVKLKKAAIVSSAPGQAGKWIQVRKDGALLDNSGTGGTSLDVLFTPTTALYNGIIIGNYASSDRTALLSIIKDQLVYRYDPSEITQATINGQAVTQYNVTVSASGQQALSAKASLLAGVDQQRINQAATIARLSGSANDHLTISIATKTQRIVQVVEQGSDNPTKVDYGNFDNIQVGQAPTAEFTWDNYVKQLTGR